jgi:hypothetical protein
MGSSNMMNGMNFFNLNASNPSSSLFGSNTGTSSATSTYKESCKYGSSTHDEEDIENEEDNERLLGGTTKSNANNSSYSERTNERASLVTGEDNTN